MAAPKTPKAPAAARSSLRTDIQVDVDDVQKEIAERVMDVAEFRFIREEAKKLGVRVYLFGGTAAAYAHYVKWDLLRKKGDTRYQPDRFDYDFTNIYRSTQDLDIVVDGTSDQIDRLQAILGEKYPHFLGSNSKWEVRSLRESKGTPGRGYYKEALLNDFDFLNQHTDSNSTGMIEVSEAPVRDVVRDLRDWNSPRPHFLEDVVEGKLTFYFSKKHFETSRAKAGGNPEILSVLRALTKAFQFDLEITPRDYATMKQIIEKTNFKEVAYGSLEKRFADIAKKLIKNAVNLEEAMNVLEEIGLRAKLKEIGSARYEDSVAWWANKEPLRSKKVGEGAGKTARELGIDVVAHETNSFLAYESITRAHTGDPNVFISRNNAAGEAAVYGNGFYTAIGREGARGTGLTIRFKVNPRAREGADFTKSGNYVVFLNKKAFAVIPESLNLDLVQYFDFLGSGDINHSDRAILEKFRRRLARMTRDVTPEEEARVVQVVKKKLENFKRRSGDYYHRDDLPAIITEFFDLDFSTKYPEILEAMLEQGYGMKAIEMMEKRAWKRDESLLAKIATTSDRAVLQLWARAFAKNPAKFYQMTLIDRVIENEPSFSGDLVTGFGKRKITVREKMWLNRIAARSEEAFLELATIAQLPDFDGEIEFVKRLLGMKARYGGRESIRPDDVVEKILSKPVWRQRADVVQTAIDRGLKEAVLKHVLVHDDVPGWEKFVRMCYHGQNVESGLLAVMTNPKSVVFAADFEKMIRGDRFPLKSLAQVLALPHWTAHPELVRLVMAKEGGPQLLSEHLFSQPHWRAKKTLVESMRLLDKTPTYVNNVLVHGSVDDRLATVRLGIAMRDLEYVKATISSVLSQPGWEKHPELIDLAIDRAYVEESDIYRSNVRDGLHASIAVALAKPNWIGQTDLMERFIRKSKGYVTITEKILSQPAWRATDLPKVFAEVTGNFKGFVEHVLVHKDTKDRDRLVEIMVRRKDAANRDLRDIVASVFIEPGWENRPEFVASVVSAVDAQKHYGGSDEWAKVLKEPRWSAHPEIMIAALKNESFDHGLLVSLLNSPAWVGNLTVLEAAVRLRPSFDVLKLVQATKGDDRVRLFRMLVENAPLSILKSIAETKAFTPTNAELVRIMDEIFVRQEKSYNLEWYKQSALRELAIRLSPHDDRHALLLKRFVARGPESNNAVAGLFVVDERWRKRRSDVLMLALKNDMAWEHLEKILKNEDLPNQNEILRELVRLGTEKAITAVAKHLATTPNYDPAIAELMINSPRANFRVVDDFMMTDRAIGNLVWLECVMRRARGSEDYYSYKLFEMPGWANHPELKHLVGGKVDRRAVEKLFASGFTFMTEEQYRKAGFSTGRLAFKRTVRETIFRRPRAATRCEALF